MSKTSLPDWVVSLAKDRRAWIPFAVIGVLLLLLSTMIIVSVETREDPEADVDEQLAFDRGEASAQAALRVAVRDAAAEAGDAPVISLDEADTEALKNASLDATLDNINDSPNLCEFVQTCAGDDDLSEICDNFGWCNDEDAESLCGLVEWCDSKLEFEDLKPAQRENHIFRNYVRLLIYQQADEQFKGTGQEIRGTKTEVSLKENSGDLVDKIERVNITVGYKSNNDLDPGMIGASIEGVEIRVIDGGEVVDSRVETLNVTVGTTLFELHNRTQEYEDLLNTGFFDGLGKILSSGELGLKGFGQEFGLRLYPIAYAKSGVKYLKPGLFNEIASNRQSEILANHAIYAVQKDAFGVSDPHSGTEMRIETACLALDIIEEQIKGYLEDSDSLSNASIESEMTGLFNDLLSNETLAGTISSKIVDEAGEDLQNWGPDDGGVTGIVCDVLRELYGDEAEGDIPLPGLTDLLGGLDTEENAVNEKRNVSINTSAALAYQNVVQNEITLPDDEDLDEDLKEWEKWQRVLDLENLTTVNNEIVNKSSGEPVENISDKLKDKREDVLKEFYKQLEESDFDGDPDTEEIVNDVYTVEPNATEEYNEGGGTVEPPGLPPDKIDGNWVLNESASTKNVDTNDIDATVTQLYDDENPDRIEPFYEVYISVGQQITYKNVWECTNQSDLEDCTEGNSITNSSDGGISANMTVTLHGEYSPSLTVDHAGDRRLRHAYTAGGDVGPPGLDEKSNFEGVPENVRDAAFGLGSDEELTNAKLETRLENNIDGEIDSDALEDASGYVDDLSDREPLDSSEVTTMRKWLENQLEAMVFGDVDEIGPPGGYPENSLLNRSHDPSVGQIKIDVEKFLDNETEGLLYGLKDEVGAAEDGIVYQDIQGGNNNETYQNVPDMARAELYQQYVDELNESIEISDTVRKRHAEDGLFAKAWDVVGWFLDKGAKGANKVLSELLGDVLNFGEKALGGALGDGDDEEAGELDSPLFEDVTFEIHGSPTYLSGKAGDGEDNTNTREDTAAVRPGDAGRFAGTNTDELFDENGNISMTPPEGTNYSTMYSAYGNPLPYPGLPVIPAIHVVQASLWNVEVGGEYPRFEVSATTGDPVSTTAYVRENQTVELEIDDTHTKVGSVKPINFTSRTFLGVLMPPGGGVGDGGPNSWTDASKLVKLFAGCQESYPRLGPDYDDFNIAELIPGEAGDVIGDITDNIADGESSFLNDINDKFPIIDPVPVDAMQEAGKQTECIAAQFYTVLEGLLGNGEDGGEGTAIGNAG